MTHSTKTQFNPTLPKVQYKAHKGDWTDYTEYPTGDLLEITQGGAYMVLSDITGKVMTIPSISVRMI